MLFQQRCCLQFPSCSINEALLRRFKNRRKIEILQCNFQATLLTPKFVLSYNYWSWLTYLSKQRNVCFTRLVEECHLNAQ